MALVDSMPLSLLAAADLSTKVNKFGKVTSTGVNVCTVAGERADLIIGSGPTVAGEGMDAYIERQMKVECGGIFAQGDPLTTDANGRAILAAAGQHVNAIALEAGVAPVGAVVRLASVLRPMSTASQGAGGAGVVNVANSQTSAGVPVVHVIAIPDAATADIDIVLDRKTEIYDAIFQKRAANAGAANTVQVATAADAAITQAIDTNINDTLLARATLINDANSTILAGGTLRVKSVKAGGNAAGILFVFGVLRA